jgi:hypothetical protein
MTDAGCLVSDETSKFEIHHSMFFIEKLEELVCRGGLENYFENLLQ